MLSILSCKQQLFFAVSSSMATNKKLGFETQNFEIFLHGLQKCLRKTLIDTLCNNQSLPVFVKEPETQPYPVTLRVSLIRFSAAYTAATGCYLSTQLGVDADIEGRVRLDNVVRKSRGIPSGIQTDHDFINIPDTTMQVSCVVLIVTFTGHTYSLVFMRYKAFCILLAYYQIIMQT